LPDPEVYSITWTENARRSLREHVAYLKANQAQRPEAWVERIFDRVEQLSTFPNLGPAWEAGGDPSLRRLVVAPHVLIYKVQAESATIAILALRHGAQDPLNAEDL
jgi:plasmid stabilization system protein ParE